MADQANALWDTIGTLPDLCLDFITLFPLHNSYGGAPIGGRTSQGARHASNGVVWSRFAGATGLRLLGAPLPVGEKGKERNAAPRARFSGQAERWLGLFDK